MGKWIMEKWVLQIRKQQGYNFIIDKMTILTISDPITLGKLFRPRSIDRL